MFPMMFLITVIGFLLNESAPGDPAIRMLQQTAESETGASQASRANHDVEILKIRKNLGLDLPVFYFRIGTLADIDTLYKVSNRLHHPLLKRLSRESGRPDLVMTWYNEYLSMLKQVKLRMNDSSKLANSSQIAEVNSLMEGILLNTKESDRLSRSDSITNLISIIPEFQHIRATWEKQLFLLNTVNQEAAPWKKWVPKINFQGIKNRYHRWLLGDGSSSRGILRGDFGLSYRDGQSIADRIGPRIKWSFFISLVALILSFGLSIPLGLYMGSHQGKTGERIASGIVFGLYALPGFFVATLLLVVFANPDVLDWLPNSGVRDPETFHQDWPFMKRLMHYIPFLILPIISLMYASMAFISRQISAGVADAYDQDFVRTARAKGLSERHILWKHILPTILFPQITLIGQLFPVLIGGSVIIESIFSIPGMGLEIYESVMQFDYPSIIAIFTLIGFMTMIGYLISDILYALLDPRVKYQQKNR